MILRYNTSHIVGKDRTSKILDTKYSYLIMFRLKNSSSVAPTVSNEIDGREVRVTKMEYIGYVNSKSFMCNCPKSVQLIYGNLSQRTAFPS